MGVEWREHQGHRYLHVDYSECKTESEMLATYEEQAKLMAVQPHKTLVLSDLTGASVSSAYMERVKTGGRERGEQLLEKAAFIGVGGLKSILLNGYATMTGLQDKVHGFETETEALNWLTTP
jgi:hypothetical protein